MPDELHEPQPENQAEPAYPPKPELPEGKTSVMRTIVSLLLYLAVDYWIFESWYAVGVLAVVVIFHELGHLAAMKLYGYKALNMTFIPFVGAYVSGATDSPSRFRRCLVLLAGPLPGIILGCVFYFLYVTNQDERFFYPGVIFLFVNVFNLLPMVPLDGGQLMENLFMNGSRTVQLVFLNLSLLGLGIVAVRFQQFVLLIFMLPLLARIASVHMKYKVRQLWDEYEANYHQLWDDVSDADYWHLRDVMVMGVGRGFERYKPGVPDEREYSLGLMIKNFLRPAAENDLPPVRKVILTLIWAVFLAGPVLMVLYYKGII
jgi:stage IV sporulation protein FB